MMRWEWQQEVANDDEVFHPRCPHCKTPLVEAHETLPGPGNKQSVHVYCARKACVVPCREGGFGASVVSAFRDLQNDYRSWNEKKT